MAKHIEFRNSWDDLAAKLIKFPAHESNVQAGDGTTTSTMIGTYLIERSIYYFKKGIHPITIKESIGKAFQIVESILQESSIPVTSESELLALARVAVNNNEKDAKLVADALLATGKRGVVLIEEGSSFENQLIVRFT